MRTEVQVEAYAGFRYPVEPRAYTVDSERRTVAEVGRTWRTPGRIHFMICDERGDYAELIYDEPGAAWSLENPSPTCPPRFR